MDGSPTTASRDSSRRNPCDLIELTATGAKVAVRGIAMAYDVSEDGRFVVVRRGPPTGAQRATAWDDAVVLELATGQDVRVLPDLDVETAKFLR